MDDNDVEALFTRVADSLPTPTEPDARGLTARARRAHRRRRARWAGAAALVVALGGLLAMPRVLDGDDQSTIRTGSFDDGGEGWARLPDGPLSGRAGATAAWTGDEVIVVGGSSFMCPPMADCAGPDEPPYADGAAFDPATGAWRSITPAPVGFDGVDGAVVDGNLYLLVECDQGGCLSGDQVALLRYDADSDSWSELPSPPNDRFYALAPAGHGLIAYATSDEQGEAPDWQFDPVSSVWSEIADDPLPAVFDRQIVTSDDGSTLLLFAAAIDQSSDTTRESVLSARLDLATGRWEELPPSPSRGYRAWGVDDIVVLEPHFSGTGGLFDPATDTWSPSPAKPDDPSWDNGVSGAFGRRTAFYGEASGWVLDVASNRWIEIPPVDERDTYPDTNVTAVGRALFVFGGQRWVSGSEGELLADAWIWRPPGSADDAGDMAAPATSTTSVAPLPSEGAFDGLTVRLEFATSTVASGGELNSSMIVENLSGHAITDPGCNLGSSPYAIVPIDDPDAELWLRPVIDCGGAFTYEPGFSDTYDGPSFPAATATGEPLPPGDYLATIEVEARRLQYPITVVP